MDKLYKYFDLTLVNQIKCSNRDENEYNNFYNYLQNQKNRSNSKIFGLPKTNNIIINNENKIIKDYVFNILIDLEKNNKLASVAILGFSKNEYGELIINFTKNISLSKNRKDIELNNKKNKK